jgi:CHAT domain-containing protein
LVASWLGFRMFRPPSAEQLLAQAYTEHRILEIRIPGAKYAPKLPVPRGEVESNLDRPPSLIKAESLIAENLRKHPNDPALLQVRARADLLDKHYDSAIKALQRAKQAEPDSSSILSDLGAAYFQRGLADPKNHADDYGSAYEALSAALVKTPDDPVALFNRAIVAENAFMFSQAEEDWEHYLRVDGSGAWSDEARDRLKRLRENYLKWKQGRSQPLLSPSQLEEQRDLPQEREIVNDRIEEYLHQAVRDWLPRSFPSDLREPADVHARAGLVILSEIARLDHGDPWLKDLLRNSNSRTFNLAVNALSAAVLANERGDYDEANRQSLLAERQFEVANNLAGVLRARFENLFTLQFIRNGRDCEQAAPPAVRAVLGSPYTWLQAEMLLQDSACLRINADVGQSRERIAQALRRSQLTGYMETYLRCITFSSDDAAVAGDLRSDWSRVLEGLGIFWTGNYPELRGYSLYDPLISAAEFASQPHLQVAAWKQAISLIDSDADLLQRGLAHFYLAQAAMDAHLLPTFDREYREYNRLLDMAPKGLAEKADRIEVQLVTARLEAKRGNLSKARDRMAVLLPLIAESDDTLRKADAYGTLGELDLQAGAIEDAGEHLRSGLAVTEHVLHTLQSDKERIEWEQKASSVYRALVELTLRNGNSTAALEIWEWYLGAAIREPQASGRSVAQEHSALSDADIPNLNTVTNHLPRIDEQTVLSYAFLRDGLEIWVYDDRGVFNAFVRRDPIEIELLAKRFLEVCADPESDVSVVHKYGMDLYKILIAPIESHLTTGRGLVVEADGALTMIPFEALVDSNSHYVGERRSVVSSLGLYYDLLLRPLREISPSDSALVVAVPTPIGFPPLPDLERETDEVADRFVRPIVLKNDEATLQSVTDALPSASAFYFAGHALATPERAGLLMADVDPKTGDPLVLTAQMLRPKQLEHLQIAILAACSTSQGENGTYTDVTSLARALVRAGVPSVVASRWQIASGASDRLNLPLVFPQRPSHTAAHPYYWASLNQFGGFDVFNKK